MRLCDVVFIGRSARNSVNQDRLSVCANVSLLGGGKNCNQSGINNSACFEQQAPVDQLGVVNSKNLSGQVVSSKQVAESENGALIRQGRST